MPRSTIPAFDLHTREPLHTIPDESVALSSGRTAPWSGIILEEFHHKAFEMTEMILPSHLMTFQLSPPVTVESKSQGKFITLQTEPGWFCLTPAGMPLQSRWREPLDVLILSADPSWVAHTTFVEEADFLKRELIPTLDGRSPQILHLAYALRAEVESGYPGGKLFGEAITTAIVTTLYQQHGATNRSTENEISLSRRDLQIVVDYIHTFYATDISLTTLAGLVYQSPFHFSRCFKAAFGMPPHRYVIQYRIEQSCRILVKSHDLSIAQIAERVGFSTQSHFGLHFRRIVGMTPSAYRAARLR